MSPKQARATALVSGLTIRSRVNLTSALVRGSPLWNLAGRSRKDLLAVGGDRPALRQVGLDGQVGAEPRQGAVHELEDPVARECRHLVGVEVRGLPLAGEHQGPAALRRLGARSPPGRATARATAARTRRASGVRARRRRRVVMAILPAPYLPRSSRACQRTARGGSSRGAGRLGRQLDDEPVPPAIARDRSGLGGLDEAGLASRPRPPGPGRPRSGRPAPVTRGSARTFRTHRPGGPSRRSGRAAGRPG